MAVLDGSKPITSPSLPPEERMQYLCAIAMGLSPMHPDDWELLRIEYDAVVAMGESDTLFVEKWLNLNDGEIQPFRPEP